MFSRTLLAFGCSFTYGTEAQSDHDIGIDYSTNPNFSYPKYMADYLGCGYVNYARGGSSNTEIANKVIEVINSKKHHNPLVIIGWTEAERFTGYTKNNKPCNITGFMDNIENNSRNLELLEHYCKEFTLEELRLLSLNVTKYPTVVDASFYCKWSLAQYLSEQNIPYLTFPALEYPWSEKYNLIDTNNNILYHDHRGKTVFDMKETFVVFARLRGFTGLRAGGHICTKTHKLLARYLVQEIVKKKILNKK